MLSPMSQNSNEFGKFFAQEEYLQLKNSVFNYRFRKYMIKKAMFRQGVIGGSGERYADIGCGISPVSPFPSKTIFVDTESTAISVLQSHGLQAIAGDILDIPLPPGSVDALFCSEVLEHIPNYSLALNELHRILKKGGLGIVTVPTHQDYWAFDDEYVGHVRRFDPSQLVAEVRTHGFEVILEQPIGSRIERFVTKKMVRAAMQQKKTNYLRSKLSLKVFHFVNSILFGLVYFGHIISSPRNSSILLLVIRKR
jgi:ubiquinone/menaquinone biosynthesis C-methylase UbiE